ncbi:MAG: ribonuclease E inhibitor RraB [Propionibacteriaceae bacterium]|nr:ribonuclease E inhibitor RraB [Propionibacteriaceae bacterium]
MGLSEFGNTTFESSGNADDDEVLKSLLSYGADLTKPRHWDHYLYVSDEASARAVAEKISAAGWALQDVVASNSGDGTWVVIAEQFDAVVNAETVRQAREFFEAVLLGVPGGEYDGWSASI